MKIQDIFKLNLNDRGGVKLFNKIMGRYNIPKADSKELINEVQNSSSGDGGIEVCYYKRIDGDVFNSEYDNMLGMILRLVNIIDPIYNKGNILVYNGIDPMSGEELPLAERLSVCVGFCMIKEETITHQVGGQLLLFPKGNMIDKLNYAINNSPSDIPEVNELYNQLLNYVNNTYQEITKEEYESMITYKPE